MPTTQAVEFVATDLDVEIAHRDEVWQSGYLVLSGEDDVGGTNRIREAEFFEFGKAFAEVELLVSVNAGMGDGFVEGNLRGPLGDRVLAFAAFEEANLDGVNFVEKIGSALDEEIGEAGSSASVDERGTMFGLELLGVAILLGAEGIPSEVGTEVEITGAKAQSSAERNFVEHRSGRIDDELAVFGGPDDTVKVSGVDLRNRNRRFSAEKAASAIGIAITTPDMVTLAFEKLGQEGAGRTRSENEDSHARKECITCEW